MTNNNPYFRNDDREGTKEDPKEPNLHVDVFVEDLSVDELSDVLKNIQEALPAGHKTNLNVRYGRN